MINPSNIKYSENIKTNLRNFYSKNNVEVSELELSKLVNNYLYVNHIIKLENP